MAMFSSTGGPFDSHAFLVVCTVHYDGGGKKVGLHAASLKQMLKHWTHIESKWYIQIQFYNKPRSTPTKTMKKS
jgi:hypothetical protein